MLTKCPECDLQVSDKALSCPHCGYPFDVIRNNKSIRGMYSSKKNVKHKRLPNGFGQITEIKGHNLRKPYRVMVTVGKTEHGKPICKLLKPQSYFETYNDAYEALVAYNKNPYELEKSLTMEELYEKWSSGYFANRLTSDSSRRTVESAWSYCSSLYSMNVREVRARHLKGCIDNGFVVDKKGDKKYPSANTKSRMKSVFNLMLDYAVEYEIVERNYARTFNISEEVLVERDNVKRGHIPFTDDEMNTLWQHQKMHYVNIILIQCYMGWRPQELVELKLADVDLEKGVIRGGMKTKVGKNRIVPIHPRIRKFVEDLHQQATMLNSEYLINCLDSQRNDDIKMTYDKYANRFLMIRDALDLNRDHRPHDPRKQFVTMAKKYNMDEYAIKRIVGHTITDITEKVYTERDIEWLRAEIEKIK